MISFFCLISVSFISTLALAFVHDHWPRQPPLPDVIFWLIPTQKWAWYAADYATGTSTWLLFIAAIFHRHRWVLFRRVFIIFGKSGREIRIVSKGIIIIFGGNGCYFRVYYYF